MFDMMKKAKEMQAKLAKAQDEIKALDMVGVAGGGQVRVRVNGSHEVLSVTLKPDVVDPADVALLEDLVKVAVNDAIRQVQAAAEVKMQAVTGGLKIPGLSL